MKMGCVGRFVGMFWRRMDPTTHCIAYLDEVRGARPALLPEQRVDDRSKEGISIVGRAQPGVGVNVGWEWERKSDPNRRHGCICSTRLLALPPMQGPHIHTQSSASTLPLLPITYVARRRKGGMR